MTHDALRPYQGEVVPAELDTCSVCAYTAAEGAENINDDNRYGSLMCGECRQDDIDKAYRAQARLKRYALPAMRETVKLLNETIRREPPIIEIGDVWFAVAAIGWIGEAVGRLQTAIEQCK